MRMNVFLDMRRVRQVFSPSPLLTFSLLHSLQLHSDTLTISALDYLNLRNGKLNQVEQSAIAFSPSLPENRH